jgi:hypothetical protein
LEIKNSFSGTDTFFQGQTCMLPLKGTMRFLTHKHKTDVKSAQKSLSLSKETLGTLIAMQIGLPKRFVSRYQAFFGISGASDCVCSRFYFRQECCAGDCVVFNLAQRILLRKWPIVSNACHVEAR